MIKELFTPLSQIQDHDYRVRIEVQNCLYNYQGFQDKLVTVSTGNWVNIKEICK